MGQESYFRSRNPGYLDLKTTMHSPWFWMKDPPWSSFGRPSVKPWPVGRRPWCDSVGPEGWRKQRGLRIWKSRNEIRWLRSESVHVSVQIVIFWYFLVSAIGKTIRLGLWNASWWFPPKSLAILSGLQLWLAQRGRGPGSFNAPRDGSLVAERQPIFCQLNVSAILCDILEYDSDVLEFLDSCIWYPTVAHGYPRL